MKGHQWHAYCVSVLKDVMSQNDHGRDRVQEASPPSINKVIETETWQRIAAYTTKSEEEVTARINEVEKEWDIERYLGVNMSTLALAGLAAAAFKKKKSWNLFPAVILGFFFQHSVQGWCPPLPILRKLKIRTRKEIEEEKYALKFIRGDFKHLTSDRVQDTGMLKFALSKV